MQAIRNFGKYFVSLFRRDGWETVGKIIRYGLSVQAWKMLLAGIRTKRIVKASGLVDEDWYRREYPEVADKGIDPVQDFLTPPHPKLRMPNPDFVPGEYAAMNFDVKACGRPWAVHYAKDGMREGRAISTLTDYEKPFPRGTEELRREFPAEPAVHRRTAVFASFSGDGRIGDTVLHYLRGLKEVVDDIVFIADNPVFPDEVQKLAGLVRLAIFQRHGCYDFGSYKLGWMEAKAAGLLDPDICDELVVCNDSCYGPVFPFQEAFAEMERRNAASPPEERFDFWGMTSHVLFRRPHIQSYFYVFGKAVLEGKALNRFFERMEAYRERGQVVYFCETLLSTALKAARHRFDSLVPLPFSQTHGAPPIKFPVTLFTEHRMPLFKAKTLKGESQENLGEAMEIVRKHNPALAAILPPPPPQTTFERMDAKPKDSAVRSARETHVESLAGKVDRIRGSLAGGNPLRLLFLTTAAEPFHGGDLLATLRGNPAYRPLAVVVPNLCQTCSSLRFAAMRDARAKLFSKFGKAWFTRAETDAVGEWMDLASGADIVCWETAENVSDFHYNPHYAVGRDFLPVLFFDRGSAGPYPPEKEFARQNYAYFWKIFFADQEDFRLYAAHSLRRGENAVLLNPGDWGEEVLRVLKGELEGGGVGGTIHGAPA